MSEETSPLSPMADEVARYARASEILADIRKDAKPTRGSRSISTDVSEGIPLITARSGLITNLEVGDANLKLGIERLEEIASRKGLAIPEEIRPYIYRKFAVELAANAQHLDEKPEKVVAVTVFQGSIVDVLNGETFPKFKNIPSMFRSAAANPTDPVGFLERADKKIDEFMVDERFERFRNIEKPTEIPWIFFQAVTSYPSDPEGYLVRVASKIDSLAADSRFAGFFNPDRPLHVPSIIMRAAMGYGGKHESEPTGKDGPAEAFLLGITQKLARYENDDRFTIFSDTPWVFTRAATYKLSEDPEKFLLDLAHQYEEKKDKPGYKEMTKSRLLKQLMKEMGVELAPDEQAEERGSSIARS